MSHRDLLGIGPRGIGAASYCSRRHVCIGHEPRSLGRALAQDKKDAKPAAPAGDKAAAAAPAGKQSAWVKLCEKAPFAKKDKDGKGCEGREGNLPDASRAP